MNSLPSLPKKGGRYIFALDWRDHRKHDSVPTCVRLFPLSLKLQKSASTFFHAHSVRTLCPRKKTTDILCSMCNMSEKT